MNAPSIYKLAITVTLIFTQAAIAQHGPPPAKVYLQTAKLELLADSRPVTGEIRSRRTAQLASQVAGLAIEVLIEEGDEVKEGQTIAKLDAQRADLLYKRAQADILSAQALVDQRSADLDQAKRDLSRMEQLQERGSVGPAQLDQSQTLVASRAAQLAEAKADHAMSTANVAIAKIELDDMTITAPFAGRVIRKQAEIGQWVDRGDPICTIVSMTDLEARIDVPQSLLLALESANGSPTDRPEIQIILPSIPKPLTARLHAVVPQADALSRLFPVRLAVDDPDHTLRPGMSLIAMIPTGSKSKLLTISKDAILRNAAGEYVYYNNNGTAALAPITRLFSVGSRVVIRSPMIRPGVQVVIEGNERMYPTQPMKIIQIDGTPPQSEDSANTGQQPSTETGSDH